VVILEDRDGELVIKPGAVVAVESYSDRQIAEWDAEDRLLSDEREAIRRGCPVARDAPVSRCNVLFTAAHNPDGKAPCSWTWRGGYWVCLTSSLAIEKARRNLAVNIPQS